MDPKGPGTIEFRPKRHAHPSLGNAAGSQSLRSWPRERSLLARAGDRFDLLFLQIDFTNHMVFGIRDVEHVSSQSTSLRMMEGGSFEISIGGSLLATADDGLHLPLQVGDDDSVVVAVGDEEPAPFAVGKHFAGKAKRGLRSSVSQQRELQRCRIEQLFLLVVGNGSLKKRIERFKGNLAAVAGDQIALRIDDAKRRPSSNLIAVPDLVVLIHDHRMLDLVT